MEILLLLQSEIAVIFAFDLLSFYFTKIVMIFFFFFDHISFYEMMVHQVLMKLIKTVLIVTVVSCFFLLDADQ